MLKAANAETKQSYARGPASLLGPCAHDAFMKLSRTRKVLNRTHNALLRTDKLPKPGCSGLTAGAGSGFQRVRVNPLCVRLSPKSLFIFTGYRVRWSLKAARCGCRVHTACGAEDRKQTSTVSGLR